MLLVDIDGEVFAQEPQELLMIANGRARHLLEWLFLPVLPPRLLAQLSIRGCQPWIICLALVTMASEMPEMSGI